MFLVRATDRAVKYTVNRDAFSYQIPSVSLQNFNLFLFKAQQYGLLNWVFCYVGENNSLIVRFVPRL